MIRLIAFAIIVILAVLAVWMPEHRAQNDGAPLVKAAVPMFPATPTWRLYTTCPVDRRNIPILEERSA